LLLKIKINKCDVQKEERLKKNEKDEHKRRKER